jgi:hypothetical protein
MATKRRITTTTPDGTQTTRVETTTSQGTLSRFLGWCLVLGLAASGLIWLVEHIAHAL